MKPAYDLAEQDPALIRQEIDHTRAALTQKLGALEDRVMGTVHAAADRMEVTIQTASHTVNDTVDAVKQSVQQTVTTLKQTFDCRRQVRRHPLASVGGCLLAGLIVGTLIRRSRPRPRRPDASPLERLNGYVARVDRSAEPRPEPRPPIQAPEPEPPGLLAQFQPEIDKAKGIAVGYVMQWVRESVKASAPQLAPQIDELMNSVTTRLGGDLIR